MPAGLAGLRGAGGRIGRRRRGARAGRGPAARSPDGPTKATRDGRSPAAVASPDCARPRCGRTAVRSRPRAARPLPTGCGPRTGRPGARPADGLPARPDGSPARCGGGRPGEAARLPGRRATRRAQRLRRLRWMRSLTVRRCRPFLRRRDSTFRPALVFMRARKPWSFTRFRFVGLEYVGLPIVAVLAGVTRSRNEPTSVDSRCSDVNRNHGRARPPRPARGDGLTAPRCRV